jgi:hypothetical protein
MIMKALLILLACLFSVGCGGYRKQLNPGAEVPVTMRGMSALTDQTSEHHNHRQVYGFFSSERGIELAIGQTSRQMKATAIHEAMYLLYYNAGGDPELGRLIGETLRQLKGEGFDTGWDHHDYWNPEHTH